MLEEKTESRYTRQIMVRLHEFHIQPLDREESYSCFPLALLRAFDTQIYVDGEIINNGTALKYRQNRKI